MAASDEDVRLKGDHSIRAAQASPRDTETRPNEYSRHNPTVPGEQVLFAALVKDKADEVQQDLRGKDRS